MTQLTLVKTVTFCLFTAAVSCHSMSHTEGAVLGDRDMLLRPSSTCRSQSARLLRVRGNQLTLRDCILVLPARNQGVSQPPPSHLTTRRSASEIDELFESGLPAWRWRKYETRIQHRTHEAIVRGEGNNPEEIAKRLAQESA